MLVTNTNYQDFPRLNSLFINAQKERLRYKSIINACDSFFFARHNHVPLNSDLTSGRINPHSIAERTTTGALMLKFELSRLLL